jgi:glycosyltransferase involved in cell wall biosynthesis
MSKIKVVHITTAHPYNDVRIFYKECRSLEKYGFQVHLIAPNAPNECIEGIWLHNITNAKRNRLVRMTKVALRAFREAIKLNGDIYHFHDPELITIGLILKLKGKKVIYDVHEDLPRAILSKHWIPNFLRKFISLVFERIENYSAKKFDMLICATPFITKRFKAINKNCINVNNYPILNELINDNHQYRPKEISNYVCYAGVINEIRGINQIIEASFQICGKIYIAGPVSSAQIMKKMDIADNIVYKGILERSRLREFLNKAIAGIVTFLPEPNHINAQPNKMFEYMSVGLPVICSDFPLWKEIIEKHDCGICVDPKDPKAIADAINYLINHPEEAERMGRNGRKAVETEYNWEMESKKLIKAYNDLLKHKK